MPARGKPNGSYQGMNFVRPEKRVGQDTAYLDYAGGQYEAWTYSEGKRYLIGHSHDKALLASKLRKRYYKVVMVSANPSLKR